MSRDDPAPTAPSTAPQPGDHRTALLAWQARVAALDATAAADTQLLAALHEAEQLFEIVKDQTVRAVQAAKVNNEAIGAALGVSKQAISKRWPGPKQPDNSDGGKSTAGATPDGDATAPTPRRRRPAAPVVEHVEARLTGLSVFKRKARLEVTRRPARAD